MAYKQIKWANRDNRPKIDIKIDLNERNNLIFKVYNIGELSTRGTAYMIIEPQKNDQYHYSSIVASSDHGDLSEEEFNKYWFAKINLDLEVNQEPFVYSYPFENHLRDLEVEEGISHFIRIEGVYESAEYGGENYKLLKRYHVLSPNMNNSKWTVTRIGLNPLFRPHVNRIQGEVPTYNVYKNNMKK